MRLMASNGREPDHLRIAFLSPSPSDAGGVTYAANVLLRALVAEGVEIDLYATACPPSLVGLPGLRPVLEPVEHGRSFRLLRRAPLLTFIWGQTRRALAQRRLASRLVEEHRRKPYDAVYQFSQPELLALRSRRTALPPIVVHPEVHAAGELAWHRSEDELVRRCEPRVRTTAIRTMLSVRSALQRRDLSSVAAVICPSAGFARELAQDYGIRERCLHVVPNPVDLERFTPTTPSRRPREIVFVSRMSVRKGVEMVVELSRRLDDLAGSVGLVIVGDMTQWSDYRPLLASLNPRVAEYRGYVEPSEMPALLAGASLLVQPSHYEPFALTVAEALASGTPVVVSDKVGAGEWLDESCAAVFPVGDVDAFEQAVRTMLRRIEQSETPIRERAREAAERSFAPAVTARAVATVLRESTHPRWDDVRRDGYDRSPESARAAAR
jgi:glycosyltransferase involved in cell wall biosynthesis